MWCTEPPPLRSPSVRRRNSITAASLLTLLILAATTLAAYSTLQGASSLLQFDTGTVLAGSACLIAMFLGLEARHSKTPEKRMPNRVQPQSGAASLQAVLQDIAASSEVAPSPLSLEPVVFDLRQTVAEAIHPLRPLARSKGLQLHCTVATDVPFQVRGTPYPLYLVLVNLLDNAIRFTAAGQVNCTVCVDACNASSVALCFRVQDTGIGMGPWRSAAKDSTDQATAPRRPGAARLGLGSTFHLIERMGGLLDVHSTPGHGSTVSFTVVLGTVADELAAHHAGI